MKGREDEIIKWKAENPAEEKILETTSKVSEKEILSNPVVLLEELQLEEELQAQIEISSKTETGLLFWCLK